ncbi:MAG: sulfate adenylyltransferase subunit 1, partial [Aeromonas veronii]
MAENDVVSEFDAYLAANEKKSLLRFLTCGSVDDGKSSLIGRLLHDSKLIYDDQLAAIKRDSRKFNTTDQEMDLALLVDGLQAEREQGITIDVAYRYFSTDRRKFIIADTPGHEQYTRNMATGASHCDLAVILVDASSGVKAQTRRHSFICSLLGIRHIVVAINKMDLVAYDETRFNQIRDDFLAFSTELGFGDITFIPLSALRGDNVVESGNKMPWYQGPSLLSWLETV